MNWIETDKGYGLRIEAGTIRARNAKGKDLKSVPAAVKKTAEYADLDNLLVWLNRHEAACGAEVERWLLRSLPVPTRVLAETWRDDAWQGWLRDLVIHPPNGGDEQTGFLREAALRDGTAQLGLVNLDGESVTLEVDEVLIPHPALLADLEDLREFAAELEIEQRFDQLHRAVHRLPEPLPDASVTSLSDWSGAHFDQLRHAIARATGAGFAVKGGYAVAPVHEGGRLIEASYWIGGDAPEVETWTEDLSWFADGRAVPVRDLGPVAYSEGVRLATHIHAGRMIEEDEQ